MYPNILSFLNHVGLMVPPRMPEVFASILNMHYQGKRFLFYGTGKHSVEVMEHLQEPLNVIGLLDDSAKSSLVKDLPCYATHEVLSINVDYDYIVLSNHLYSNKMQKLLISYGVDKEKILNLYDLAYMDFYSAHSQTSFYLHRKEKPIFLVITPFENADHFSRNVFGLSAHFDMYKMVINAHSTYDVSAGFCDVMSVNGSLFYLKQMIENNRDKIEAVGLNLVPGHYYLFPFLRALLPLHVKIFVSIIDWLSLFGEKEKIENNFDFVERFDDELLFEKEIQAHADGIINSLDGEIFETKILKHQKNALQYFNYVSSSYMVFKDISLQLPIRLCYAGGVFPSSANEVMWEDIKMIKVFKPLLAQNFQIKAYMSFNSAPIKSGQYDDYLMLQKENKQFEIFEPLPIEEFLKNIADLHFGLMIYDFKKTKEYGILEEHLSSVVPSKLFTYLSAGIPVIVSEELEAVARLVRKHHLGIVVSQNEIFNLKNLLHVKEYITLKEAVKNFQTVYSAENQFHRLEAFLT